MHTSTTNGQFTTNSIQSQQVSFLDLASASKSSGRRMVYFRKHY
jgi:hypothetical protein